MNTPNPAIAASTPTLTPPPSTILKSLSVNFVIFKTSLLMNIFRHVYAIIKIFS